MYTWNNSNNHRIKPETYVTHKGGQNTMGRGYKIQWVGGTNYHGKGVDIPSVGGKKLQT